MITQEEVKHLFDYLEGQLIYTINAKQKPRIGQVAGGLDIGSGYYRCKVQGKSYLVHRLIYLWHHGVLPAFIDHINQDPLDNRIENLRSCTQSQNNRNGKKRSNCTSPYIGVLKANSRWRAVITIEGVKRHLGTFDTEEEAARVYDIELIKAYNEFASTNFNKENYNRKT